MRDTTAGLLDTLLAAFDPGSHGRERCLRPIQEKYILVPIGDMHSFFNLKALKTKVVMLSALDAAVQTDMLQLYAQYYTPVDQRTFAHDLSSKTHIILLRDGTAQLRGFSTIRYSIEQTPAGPMAFMFSGDTIIAHEFWGTQALPCRWIELAGTLKAGQPSLPLYWLLITKGHRTYRLLNAFARNFYPSRSQTTPSELDDLMGFIGDHLFGRRYNPRSGIVQRVPGSAALKSAYEGITPSKLAQPEIEYFLHRNPDFAKGDELLCLCELSVGNLRPIVRPHFERGYAVKSLGTVA